MWAHGGKSEQFGGRGQSAAEVNAEKIDSDVIDRWVTRRVLVLLSNPQVHARLKA